jgi:nucleotide-binding universal stress UspA family protein
LPLAKEADMALRDIAVFVDSGRANDARVALAASLAWRHAAHLAAIHVVPIPAIPPYCDSSVVRRLIKLHTERVAEIAQKLERGVQEAARREGVTAEWRAQRDFYDVGVDNARYADLLIVGQPDPDDPVPELMADTRPEQLALSSGRPVLAVPYAGKFGTTGTRILVAWKPGREATRAVHDALPLLERADAVTVLVIDPEEDRAHGEEPGADIARHLARHGVKVEVEQTVSGETKVADVMLSRAADLGSDLIVMGAYGHSRMREFVLGGVTREILQHMTVPVLLSH